MGPGFGVTEWRGKWQLEAPRPQTDSEKGYDLGKRRPATGDTRKRQPRAGVRKSRIQRSPKPCLLTWAPRSPLSSAPRGPRCVIRALRMHFKKATFSYAQKACPMSALTGTSPPCLLSTPRKNLKHLLVSPVGRSPWYYGTKTKPSVMVSLEHFHCL